MIGLGLFLSIAYLLSGGSPARPEGIPQGQYVAEGGYEIEVSGDRAVIRYVETHHLPVRCSDTVAVCKVTAEDDTFFRLDSEDPYVSLAKGISFQSSYDPALPPDSLYISFDIPSCRQPLDITVVAEHDLKMVYHLHGPEPAEGMFPDRRDYIFGIVPEDGMFHDDLSPLSPISGLAEVFPILVEDGSNRVVVRLESLDNGFFERMWIRGEYVKMEHDLLVWRGMRFYPRSVAGKGRSGLAGMASCTPKVFRVARPNYTLLKESTRLVGDFLGNPNGKNGHYIILNNNLQTYMSHDRVSEEIGI